MPAFVLFPVFFLGGACERRACPAREGKVDSPFRGDRIHVHRLGASRPERSPLVFVSTPVRVSTGVQRCARWLVRAAHVGLCLLCWFCTSLPPFDVGYEESFR